MSTINVASANLDPEAARFVHSTVATYLSGAGWNFVSTPDLADILLVDLDTPAGASAWARLDGSRRPVRVAVTADHGRLASALAVGKPLRYSTLLSTLRRAANGEPGAGEVAGGASRFDPGKHLLGVIQGLVAGGRSAVVDHPDHAAVAIDSARRRWAVAGDRPLTPDIFRLPAGAFEMQMGPLPAALDYRPLEELLYRAAWHASNGRLQAGTDLSTPLRLRRWPDFTRVPYRPIHLRMAAYPQGRSATPLTIAERTGAAVSDVHDLLNACRAAGLITEARSESRPPPEQPSAASREGLLARIRMRLLGGAGKPRAGGDR